jgi:hypothetical protein
MNGRKIVLRTGLMICIVLGLTGTSIAASTVAMTPSGGGSFVLQGSGVENAAAMDIIINYDASSLASPRVTQGALIAGSMVAINNTTPGIVRMGIIRTTPIQGTGVIATLNFTTTGDAPGNILALKVSFSNINGKPLPVVARITNPPSAAPDNTNVSSSQDVQSATASASAAPAGGAPAAPLVAAVPSGASLLVKNKEQTSVPAGETDPVSEQTATSQADATSADAVGITASAEPSGEKIQRLKSVLDRFKDYKGERTRKAFVRLFEQDEMSGVRQYPPVALSDGKTPVRVTFISNTSSKAADVAVMGARFVSIKKDPDYSNTWSVTLVPEKDTYEVSLAVSQRERKMVYPLAVAPQARAGMNRTVIATAQDFDAYLKGRKQEGAYGKGKKYLNDYIVTANYLYARQIHRAAPK